MQVLNPDNFVTTEISEAETTIFEAFLDRSFPDWRQREMFTKKNTSGIRRKWLIGHDGIERNALYRKQYVEIYDEYYHDDDCENVESETLKHRICNIDGDLTPVAVWGER